MEELVEKQRILGVLAMKKRLEKRSSKVSDKRLIEMSKDNFNVGGGQGLGNYILNSGSNTEEGHDQSVTNHQKQTKPLLENEDENKKEKRKRRTKAQIEEDRLETEKQVELAKEKQASLLKSIEGVDATELQKERNRQESRNPKR